MTKIFDHLVKLQLCILRKYYTTHYPNHHRSAGPIGKQPETYMVETKAMPYKSEPKPKTKSKNIKTKSKNHFESPGIDNRFCKMAKSHFKKTNPNQGCN